MRCFLRGSVFPTAAVLALTSTTASAQPVQQDADEAAFKGQKGSATIYDFEDDNVDGEILSPDGALISARGGIKHASLITIRRHFLPELIKMAQDI